MENNHWDITRGMTIKYKIIKSKELTSIFRGWFIWHKKAKKNEWKILKNHNCPSKLFIRLRNNKLSYHQISPEIKLVITFMNSWKDKKLILMAIISYLNQS